MEWSFLQETRALHGDALQTRGHWGTGKACLWLRKERGIRTLKVPSSRESKMKNLNSKPPLLDAESE